MSNIRDYTPEQREKIKQVVNQELEKSFDINKFGKGTPLWMNLLFILQKFNEGNYYGTIEIKILGTACNDAKEKERTHKMMEIFTDP